MAGELYFGVVQRAQILRATQQHQLSFGGVNFETICLKPVV